MTQTKQQQVRQGHIVVLMKYKLFNSYMQEMNIKHNSFWFHLNLAGANKVYHANVHKINKQELCIYKNQNMHHFKLTCSWFIRGRFWTHGSFCWLILSVQIRNWFESKCGVRNYNFCSCSQGTTDFCVVYRCVKIVIFLTFPRLSLKLQNLLKLSGFSATL